MGKQPPKMTALVVSAIRNLREVQGSTPKEILNYIVAEYNAANSNNDTTIKRKLATALKRGLEYGILKHTHGHYSLNTDPETIGPTEDMLGPMERGGRGCKGAMKSRSRRRRRRAGKCGSRSSRRSRRRKRGKGCGSGGRKRRRARKGRSRGGCKSRSRRTRSRRGKSRKCGGGKRRRARRSGRRSRRGKSKCGSRRGEDVDVLVKDPIEATRNRENLEDVDYAYEREDRRSQSRGRQSPGSRSRSPSHSRSSGSSDREGNDGNRRDRQVERGD